MNKNKQQYIIVELQSGFNFTHRYDRIGALLRVHELNKKNPNERYAICAV